MAKSDQYFARRTAWVWFKHGLNVPSQWESGFTAIAEPFPGFYRLEHREYRTEILPSWRISFSKPADIAKGPPIELKVEWRYAPS